MDHQAFAQLLGNYGEFVGAIAVVLTLFYLALQVRHSKQATEANTRSIDENRKVAMAQIYHARSAESAAHYRTLAESEYIPVRLKFNESGIDSLSAEELARLRFQELCNLQRMDSTFYAHQLGLLDEEYYQSIFVPAMQALAPSWKELGLPPSRSSFDAEVDYILTLDPRPGSSGFGEERPVE